MQNVKPSSNKRLFDTQINILLLQFVTVFIVVAIALCLRFFGGRLYLEASTLYHEKFDSNTSANEVLEQQNQEIEQSDVTANTSVEETEEKFEELLNIDTQMTEYDFSQIKNNLTLSNNVTNNFIWPAVGRISSHYGYRTNPVTNIYGLHGGTDIAVVTGTPVKAALGGKVYAAGESPTYGKYVILDHGGDVLTVYAHCSRLLVKGGASISQGDIVALSGNTGRSTGAHLHFEIRINGSKINPEWLLGKMVTT